MAIWTLGSLEIFKSVRSGLTQTLRRVGQGRRILVGEEEAELVPSE